MVNAVQKMLRNIYGGDVETRHYLVNGGADRNNFIQNNPERVALTIINNTTDRGAIRFKQSADTNEHIYIEPNGGSIILTAEDDGDLQTYPIYNNLLTVDVEFYVIEVVRVNIEEGEP